MKIQLKRSSVLDGGVAKQPTAGQMEYGELAVNYNENDPAIFIKDSNNQIIRIAGAGYDYNDLENIPTIGDGTITISANGETVGTFTVNQEGDTEIELPDSGKLNPPSPSEPGGTNENGDLWIDSSACPPVLKIWSDCDGTGKWYVLAAAGPQPIAPQPGDGSNSTTPAVLGSGTEADPYILTAATVEYGETAESVETISLIGQTPANLVQWSDINSGSNGNRFAQPVGVIAADGTWSGKVYFADAPDSTSELTYEGLLKLGGLHYKWEVTMLEPSTLEVSKGLLSPTAGETGETFVGSATVVNAENPVEVHVFSMDDVEVQRGASNSYVPTAEGNLTYHKEVTDDNNQSPVIGAESNPAVITQPPGPTATMSGLRFDRTRRTKLIRSVSDLDTFTASVWYKCTKLQDFNNIITLPGVSDPAVIRCKANGDISVAIGGTDQVTAGAGSLVANQWTHIVVTAVSGGAATISVNGSSPVSGSGVPSLAGAIRVEISGNNNSQNQEIDGYLSDVYFVDGKIAPPTIFGKTFEGGKWGPLDSAVIQNNLNNLQPADPTPEPGPGEAGQPYDRRANTDQVWSSGTVTGTPGSQGFEVLFNGSLNAPGVGGNADATSYKLDYGSSKISGITSFRYYANSVSASGAGRVTNARELKVNGIELTTDNTSADSGQADGSPGWYKVEGITEFTSIEFPATNIQVAGIEVNGRLLVDNGLWNSSQNWSSGQITGVAANTSGPWTELFDGNLSTRPGPKSGDFYKIEFTPAIDTTGVTCEIYGSKGSGSGVLKVNGSDFTFTNTTSQWVTIPTGNALTSLEFPSAGSADPAIIFGIRVNGAILVDSGEQWDTSQIWSDDSTMTSGFQNPGTIINGVSVGPANLAFDGSLDTAAVSSGTGTRTFTFASQTDIAISTRLEVYVGDNGATGSIYTFGCDGATQEFATTTVKGWLNVTNLVGKTISTTTPLTITQSRADHGNWIWAIKVDDKILVDATPVWNTSQIWSDGVSGSTFNAGQGAENGFDGSVTTSINTAGNGASDFIQISFSSLTVNTKLEVFTDQQVSVAPNATSGLQGSLPAGTVQTNTGTWTDLSFTGSLTSLRIMGANDGSARAPRLSAVKVDGEILVDAAPTWNSSQVWSDVYSFAAPNNGVSLANFFDGDESTSSLSSGDATLNFTGGLAYAESVEVYSNSGRGGVNEDQRWTLNSESPVTAVGGWTRLATGSGTINTIRAENLANSAAFEWGAIKVDGALLVDAGLGSNGFYLPFDPTATGENYSDGATASQINGAVSNLFNGDITSGIFAVNNGAYNIISIPSGKVSIQAGDKLELYNVRNHNNTIIKLNGIDFSKNIGNLSGVPGGIDLAKQGRWDDITAAISGGAGSLTEIQIFNNTGENTSGVSALRINGKTLVDHSSIGVDMSGNKNNFHDQSFVTSQKIEGDFSASSALSSPTQAFNGSLTNGGVAETSETIVFDGQSIPANTIQFLYSCGAARAGTLYFNDASTQAFTLPTANKNWLEPVTFGATKTLTKVVFNGGTPLGLNAVYADGVILVDTNTAADTVTDTPLRNYATLQSGSNGNLVGSGALTYKGESGKSYYYETNGEVVTSPAPVGNAATGIHNFGQQPFVNPRITSQDLDAGTVTLGDEKFDGSQEFSASATVTGSADTGIANLGTLFNGDPSPVSANTNIGSSSCVSGQNYGSTYPGQFPAGDYEVLVGWSTGGGSLTNFTASLGGNSYSLNVQNLAAGGSFVWLPIGTAASPFNGLSFNCVCNGNGNAGYYQAAVKVNGKLLVDSSIYNTWNTSQNWSSYGTGVVVGGGWGDLFDGILETNKAFISPDKDGILTWTAPNPIPISTSLEFFGRLESSVPEDRKLVVTYVDNSGNESTETISGTLSNTTFLTYSFSQAAGKSLKSFTFQGNNGSGQTNQLYGGITIDGKILVDSGAGIFYTLYQTWVQYARTSLGYSLDRIAQLEALRLLDAATIEDLRTKIAEALSRVASLESDEVNDDAVDNSLITLVGTLSTQVTSFTDRIAAAEAAITDYEGRITNLES